MSNISRENLKAILIDFKTKTLGKDAETLQSAKEYADGLAAIGFKALKVEALPELSEAKEHILYLVPKTSGTEENNICDEYVLSNGAFEIVGSTKVTADFDTSNFYTKSEIDAKLTEMSPEEINQFNEDLWGAVSSTV